MYGIEELRQRVQDAEQHFGLAREEQIKYIERLVGLFDAVEERLRDQQAEIDSQQAIVAGHTEALAKEQAQISHLESDNEQLREMLHSLLQAIETGGRGSVAEIMRTLDQKVSALIADGAAPAVVVSEPEPEPEPEPELEAEPEPEDEPEDEIEVAAEPVEQVAPEEASELGMETVPEPMPEAAPDLVAEAEAGLAKFLEIEATPEPEAEPAPEPVMQTAPVPVAEFDSEPAPEPEVAAPEIAREMAPEMSSEAIESVEEPSAEPNAEAVDAQSGTIAAPLEEIAGQLGTTSLDTPRSDDSIPEYDSLHDIMDRVSKLVRETDTDESAAPAEAATPTGTPPEKKSAAS